MVKSLEMEIEQIIVNEMAALNRSDLFRKPLVAFSSANDERYTELKKIIGEWHLNPTELLPDAKSVISYFVPFTKPVVSEPKAVEGASALWGEAYEIINRYFNNINESVSAYLIGLGFSAKAIQATHTYDPKELKSMWSHRSAAAIAGLGAFGANRLLITEKGSGGRFCSVMTSATLNREQNQIHHKGCLYMRDSSCGMCFKICPVNALGPNTFNKFACLEEVLKNEKKLKETAMINNADVCGKCISICPLSYIE